METPVFRFGEVVIDPRTREVRRGGETVAVQKRVFDLLLYLVTHRDRAVGKDELQERVWPGMIVTETALTRAVMKARRAVGDDSDRQAVIRTVHGHGYRFIAELDEVPRAEPAEGAAVPGAARGSVARAVGAWGVLGTVVLVSLVAVAALLMVNTGVSHGGRIAVLPVADRTGDPDLAWAGLGLMSYVNRLLAEGSSSDTVPARQSMAAAEKLPAEPSDGDLQAVREALGASHLVHATLERSGERLVLGYRVAHAQGISPPNSLTGEDATGLARELARAVISGLPGTGLRREFRSVSADPFVNEAYARGMALQLQGEIAKARDYFAVAVRQDPGLFWPRYELALTMRDMGELDAARDNLETLVERAAVSSDMQMRAAANNALAQVHWRQGEFGQADSAYLAAMEAARAMGDPAAESVILVNRGILARIQGDLQEARRHLAAALAATERTDTPDRASIYQSLGQVEWAAGELPLAMDYYRRAHDEFRAANDRRGMAASLNAMARVQRRLGQFADAETNMLAAYRVRRELGDYFGRFASLIALAELYVDQERWDEAAAHAERALALARQAADRSGMADALRARAAVALAAGDATAAAADLAVLEDEYPDERDEPMQTLLTARLAMLEGRMAEAGDLLAGVLADGTPAARIDALDILATGAPSIGAARKYWQEALGIARDNHERGRSGRILLAMTRRELEAGELDAARANSARLVADFGDWPGVVELRQRLAMATTED